MISAQNPHAHNWCIQLRQQTRTWHTQRNEHTNTQHGTTYRTYKIERTESTVLNLYGHLRTTHHTTQSQVQEVWTRFHFDIEVYASSSLRFADCSDVGCGDLAAIVVVCQCGNKHQPVSRYYFYMTRTRHSYFYYITSVNDLTHVHSLTLNFSQNRSP